MVDSIITEQEPVQSKIQIEVVYGLPNRQELMTLLVDEGTLLEEAIIASGILKVFEEIDLTVNNVGIWNRAAKLTDKLRDLDRIEIYRPLIADPKEVRKRRAEKAKDEGRADKVTGGRVDPRRNKAS
ncbi:MAG: RnfH family protein [Colwellia sp.]|jgi:putative ubiquitin-RnfH superfamily antitoxin RatB of RatAB toxin-antitoxin module|uniref:RnfH family protein n=1 Tax=Colwellia sp. Bg11-12 TaxID=2759817 RepID=UPI0015F6CD19|nr:RnfH family protein [Colwellia sp. Bg11-12]MBA6262169.1 RnfH family protein [Colwellia sp. Bg11-12]